jgi:hypothetical protein
MRDCLGPVYCGYQTLSDAVAAYNEAVAAGTTKVLPLIILEESEPNTSL